MTAFRDFMKVYWPLIAVTLLSIIIALVLMDPAPPKKVRFAAGSPGGAYHAYAERYQNLLEGHGVTVELVDTSGSIDNLRLLADHDVDIGIVQGGLAKPSDAELLQSLGGIYQEPLFIFVRLDDDAVAFEDLRTKRFAIGAEGSGTRQLVREMQREFGGVWPEATQMDISGMEAATALQAGGIDAAAFSASASAPYVDRLLRDQGVRLIAFPQAAGIARRHKALDGVQLLRGVVDVGANIPAKDIPLVASVAQLVVHEDLHPAIKTLLVESAMQIHAEGTSMSRPGTFPDPDLVELPISPQAARYYRNGPSFLRRYFPFGMANFLDRAWVLAIPLLTLAFPLVRAGPPLYRWRVRRRIYIWYDDLRRIEKAARVAETDEQRQPLMQELSVLQAEVGNLEVPLSYTDDLYRLRNHIEFVKHLIVDKPFTNILKV